MSDKSCYFKENIPQEEILHISVGDPAFETLEGQLRSGYAPEYARRCGVDVNDCGDFFVNCNLATGSVIVCATYYPSTNEPGTVINVPLEEAEKRSLLQAVEAHCQMHYKKSGLQILNNERVFLGLPPVKPRKPALHERIADAAKSPHSSVKDIGNCAEQKNQQER